MATHECILGKRHRKHRKWKKREVWIGNFFRALTILNLLKDSDVGYFDALVYMECVHCQYIRVLELT
jgi:hypothetical protein